MGKTRFFENIMGLLLLVMLAGCAGTQQREETEPVDAPDSAQPQPQRSGTSEPRPHAEPLTPDIIYAVLVGEVAAQRRQLEMAATHYKHAAKLSRDVRTAERAARIAAYVKKGSTARETAEIWVGLDPDNPDAHQIAAAIYAREQATEQAIAHFKELVRLTNHSGISGFMHAAAVAGKLKDKDYGLELMRRLAAEYEQNHKALYAYSVVAVGAEKYDLAESTIREVLEIKPDWAEASVLLSRILSQKGDSAQALAVLEQSIQSSPENLALRTAYARRLVEEQDLERAYEQFQELLKLQPQNPDILFSAGIVALQLNDTEAARGYLKALVDKGIDRDEVVYYLGQTEEMAGNDQAAVEWYKKVSGSYRLDADIHRAKLLAKTGKLDQARELIQRLRVQEPEKSIKLLLIEAEILREVARPDDVMALYDLALKSYPNNADLLYARALFAVEQGRLDILESDLRKVINDNPDHADALNALGYSLADQTSRYEEALGYIHRALNLKPDNAAVLDSMGWVQYRLGHVDKALHYLRRALEILPDAEIAAHLGEVLWATGDRDQARKIWRDALAENPDSEQLQKLMKHGPEKK